MKTVGITSTAILSLLFGIAAPAYAQHEQGEKQDHPQQQESRHEQAKPNAGHAQPQRPSGQSQQQPQRAQQQQRPAQNNQPERAQQQQRPAQNNQPQRAQQQRDQNRQPEYSRQRGDNQPARRSQEQQRVQQSAWQQHGSQHWDSDHRTWRQRGGYRGYRIPDDRFRGYFGPSHEFRIYGLPFLVVGGYPRFQYNGYWISAIDPWPEYWGNNWYDNDDVYVNYVDNGYYLYNRRYPDVGIAISISM
jgi:hypothetical protein